MSDFDYKSLAPLIIVVTGWVLTSISSITSRLFMKRRIRNEVVFNLLEVYHNVTNVYKLETFIKFYPGYIKLNHEASIDEKLFQSQFGSIIKTVLRQTGYIKSMIIREDFPEIIDDSIIKLSQIDPVTAYKIRGSNIYFEITEMFEKYFESVKNCSSEHFEFNEDDSISLKLLQEKITEKVLVDRLKFLSSNIRKISPKLNPYKYFQIRKLTEIPEDKNEEEMDKMFKELFDILKESDKFKFINCE